MNALRTNSTHKTRIYTMEVEVNLTQLWIIISVVICSLTEQTCGEWHYLFIFLIMHLEVSVLAYIWIFCWLRYSYVGLLLYDIRWWLCVWFPTLADRAGIHVLGSHRHMDECQLSVLCGNLPMIWCQCWVFTGDKSHLPDGNSWYVENIYCVQFRYLCFNSMI